MTISIANESHIEAFVQIIASTFHLACPADSDRSLQSDYISNHLSADAFLQILNSPHHHTWVAYDGQIPVGLAVLEKVSKYSGMLSKLYVLPSHHGKGVATQLANNVIQQAKDSGLKTLRLTVFSGNFKAKAFYEKLGFTLIDEIDFIMETELHKDHLYKLDIR